MLKKTFKIPDMTCTNCAMKIEALEDDLDGVKEINASYHKLEMVIEYDLSGVHAHRAGVEQRRPCLLRRDGRLHHTRRRQQYIKIQFRNDKIARAGIRLVSDEVECVFCSRGHSHDGRSISAVFDVEIDLASFHGLT